MKITDDTDTLARFWDKVDVCGADECWPWTATLNSGGYGNFRSHGRNFGAHRLAYAIEYGPAKDCVLHRCDNRPCCNPKHLFDGTHLDNTHDMIAKGRDARHDRHGMARLALRDVRAIRELHELKWSGRDIAWAFRISFATASLIVNQKLWVNA